MCGLQYTLLCFFVLPHPKTNTFTLPSLSGRYMYEHLYVVPTYIADERDQLECLWTPGSSEILHTSIDVVCMCSLAQVACVKTLISQFLIEAAISVTFWSVQYCSFSILFLISVCQMSVVTGIVSAYLICLQVHL